MAFSHGRFVTDTVLLSSNQAQPEAPKYATRLIPFDIHLPVDQSVYISLLIFSFTIVGRPPRWTVNEYSFPSRLNICVSLSKPSSAAGRPLTETIVSPSLKPAFAAGKPALTRLTLITARLFASS